MSVGKWVVLVVWVASILGYSVSSLAVLVFWLLVVAHAVECLVFLPKLRATGGSFARHLVQTMLFGVFHLRELSEPGAGPDSGAGSAA